MKVAPYTGAWIETSPLLNPARGRPQSHPTRVRGLKLYEKGKSSTSGGVAPYTGAWIETTLTWQKMYGTIVAPYTGAWIETNIMWLSGAR